MAHRRPRLEKIGEAAPAMQIRCKDLIEEQEPAAGKEKILTCWLKYGLNWSIILAVYKAAGRNRLSEKIEKKREKLRKNEKIEKQDVDRRNQKK